MKIHTFEQNTPEWFAVRLGKFTASTAQAIASNGKGLETLCFEKVAEIISGTMEYVKQNPDMERGVEQEKLARMSYELKTGNKVDKVGFMELNDKVGASPDGLVGEDGMTEFKCHKNAKFASLLYTMKPESKYVWQMQMQMYVADRKWNDFVAFNENFDEPIIIRYERDEAKIEKIRIGIEAGNKKVAEILGVINARK